MFTTEEILLDWPQRELIALRQEHGDLNAMIDAAAHAAPLDELVLRRLKKKRLALRDKMTRLESALIPDDLA
ncbi:DUF465 domain-containing protein [Curvibacter sp. APW13]|uniref:YdcH family protein n=1 Tax=Curvibacter sp. APW13 TaxID=3077236 RepID=UPI0028DF51C4|nr:DUF465 domain-containing protein [Curvibacter sp. APW13]MDT8991731.1 DUF465 domain-containing protein [Curvibacter sp. APW13]